MLFKIVKIVKMLTCTFPLYRWRVSFQNNLVPSQRDSGTLYPTEFAILSER